MIEGPILNEQELMQPCVMKIVKYFEERLAKLRIDNDPLDAPLSIRGRIAEIKSFQKNLKQK